MSLGRIQPSTTAARTNNLVDVGVHVLDDFDHFFFGNAVGLEDFPEVVYEELEVAWFDAPAVMDMSQRPTAVNGIASERYGEKFALHGSDMIHGRVLEEGREIFIVDDAFVKLVDKGTDGLLATDTLKEGWFLMHKEL